MAKRSTITSPYQPDLASLRAWLEKMIASMKLAELIVAVVALVTRMRDINTELSKQLAGLRKKRPRSETLKRLERQLVLPLDGLAAERRDRSSAPKREPKSRRGRHPGRAALPPHLPRVPVDNPVPPEMRICPICGAEMTNVGHRTCEVQRHHPGSARRAPEAGGPSGAETCSSHSARETSRTTISDSRSTLTSAGRAHLDAIDFDHLGEWLDKAFRV